MVNDFVVGEGVHRNSIWLEVSLEETAAAKVRAGKVNIRVEETVELLKMQYGRPWKEGFAWA